MTEQVMLAIVGGIVTIMTAVFGGTMTYLMAKLQRQGAAAAAQRADAAVKTEEVKAVLKENNIESNRQLGDIHTLVNANMGAQLQVSSVALRRVADLTGHPDDIAAAEIAENKLREHLVKQAIVDEKDWKFKVT